MANDSKTAVLLIGLIPELVDFSSMPGMTAEKVHAGLLAEQGRISAAGYDAHQLLIDMGETAESVIQAKLAERVFGHVVIGAGLRVVPAHHLIFEKVINVVHAGAPHSRIVFNTSPTDSLEGIRRWPAPAVA